MISCFFKFFLKRYECPVCIKIFKINYFVLFNCGHLLCYQCSNFINNCAMCRQIISHRYNIYSVLTIGSLSNIINYVYCKNCRCVFSSNSINTYCINCNNQSELFKVYFI